MNKIIFLLVLVFALPVFSQEKKTEEPGEIKIIDDFEDINASKALWNPKESDASIEMEASKEHVTQGKNSAKLTFRKGVKYPWMKILEVPVDLKDWTKYKSLKFDIYNPDKDVYNWSLRLDDEKSGGYQDRMNMDDPGVLLLPERNNHVELDIRKIAAMNGRNMDKTKIKLFGMGLDQQKSDKVLFIDNLCLDTKKAVKMETKMIKPLFSGVDDQDPELGKRRDEAEKNMKELKGLIEKAQEKNLNTSYYEIYSLVAELAIKKRIIPVWFDKKKERTVVLDWLDKNLKTAISDIKDEIIGKKVNTRYPGYAPIEQLTLKDGYFGIDGEPKLFFAAASPKGKLKTFFAKDYYYTTQAIAGRTRYNVDGSDLLKAYERTPEMHRVGWKGFCGHIIRDGSSFSVKGPEIVLCLESPKTKEIVRKIVVEEEKKYKGKDNYLMDAIGWELSYVCFCDFTLAQFKQYLKKTHADIAALNTAWGSNLKSFDDVTITMESVQETRGKWYDFANFNTLRFAELMKNASGYVKAVDPARLTGGGSPHLYFSSNFWKAEDGELTQGQYMDVGWCEGGPDTLQVDLVKSFTGGKKPIFDMEYHGDISHMFLQYLHGMNGINMWMWADSVASEPNIPVLGFAADNIAISWEKSLDDVAKLLKDSLDIRRFSKEITAFGRAPEEIGVVYSRSSTLQVPPQLISSLFNPHIFELRKVYEATLEQDTFVKFVTEKQLAEGKTKGLKVIVVPAAEFVIAEAAAKLVSFVKDGGTLVVTPNSLLADQYAGKKDYLKELGIEVLEVKAPSIAKKGSGQSGFIQEAQDEIAYTDVKKEKLKILDKELSKEELEAVGVRQTVKAPSAKVLASFEDGTPAIITLSSGKGNVFYLTMPLNDKSMWKVLNYAFTKSGVERGFRVKDALTGEPAYKVEARMLSVGGKNIAYVFNDSKAAAQLRIEVNGKPAVSLFEKRTDQNVQGGVITVPGGETYLLEVK